MYAVSNLGRVRANDRLVMTNTGIRHYKERILKHDVHHIDGHHRVAICINGKAKKYLVHRLVAEAFLENPNNYPVINHKDENPNNNRADNLEWCTHSYNNNYNGRNIKIGEIRGTSVDVFDKNNKYIETIPSANRCSIKYNISSTTLWRRVRDGKMINNYIFKIHS